MDVPARPTVEPFFDAPTNTFSYVVSDPATGDDTRFRSASHQADIALVPRSC